MNKQRRKEIEAIATRIKEVKSDLETLADEESDGFENMPESLQDGDRGQAIQEAMENLEYAYGSLDEVTDYLEAAVA